MTDWVVDLIERLGEVGVGLLIFLENIIPPIPSEVVLPFAGFAAERGSINVFGAWLAATAGSLAGALVLYALGALIGLERLEHLAAKRWFVFFGKGDLDRGIAWFDRHGGAVVFFGRFIPLVRSVVSVPAGLDRMPLGRFAVLTAAGSSIWNAAFIGAGWTLGERWEQVEEYVAPVGYLVAAVLAVGLIVLSVRKLRRRRSALVP